MMKLLILSYFLCLLTLPIFSQTNSRKIDSLETLVKNYSAEDTMKVKLMNALSWELRFLDYPKSMLWIEATEILAKKIDYPRGLATALSNKALIFNRIGNYPKSVESILHALKIFQTIKDDGGIAGCYTQIAITQSRQGNFAESIKNFKVAYELFTTTAKDKYSQGRVLNNMGNAFVLWTKPDSALRYLKLSMAINKKIQSPLLLYNKYNLGMAYFQKQDYALAERYFFSVIDSFRNQEDKVDRYIYSKCFINVSDVYMAQNLHQKALIHLRKGLEVSKLAKLKPEMQEANQKLSILYAIEKKYDSAYIFQSMSYKIKDSLAIKESSEKLIYAQGENDREKQNILMKLQEQESEKKLAEQRLYIYSALGIGFTMLVVVFFVLRSRQIQKRLSGKLSVQNRLLQVQQEKLQVANEELRQSQEEISSQRDFIESQNLSLSDKNIKITESINVALKLQKALLPFESRVKKILPNYFVIYQPKDIVSGDFYWIEHVGNKTIIVVADCVGHGVPGAFMSLIGFNLLDRVVLQKQITEPSQILKHLNFLVQSELKQEETEDAHNSMDVGVIVIEKQNDDNFLIEFAGAKRPLFYFSDAKQTFDIAKGARKSVGGYQNESKDFFTETVILPKNSLLYLFSDGFTDQNNVKRMRLGEKVLLEKLSAIYPLPLDQQQQQLDTMLENYMEDTEQRDDIMFLGIKL